MTPNTHIPYVPEGTLDPAAGLNVSLDHIDALLQTAVISMSLTAPPSTGSDGDLYIVGEGSPTGEWAGHEHDLARYVSEGSFWQFFTAGTEIRYVLNLEDNLLYRFIDGSPPGWFSVSSVVVQDTDSPPTVVDPANVIVFGAGTRVSQLEAGAALVEADRGSAVVNYSLANLNADETNAGNYTRFSHASPTYTFGDELSPSPYEIGAEYHGRYVGAGSLMIVAATGFTINAPSGGTLEIPPGGTFTVKIVAEDEADLYGVTVP